jgi:YHS domain-containing protein
MAPLPSLFLALSPLFAVACVAPESGPAPDAPRPVNTHCPRSGKPVSADCLTTYRGEVVGFCNPHCRDDFAAHPEQCPDDRAFFDEILDGER